MRRRHRPSIRGFRGGGRGLYYALTTCRRPTGTTALTVVERYNTGFRVASVPEPGTIALLLAGAACLLAFAWRKRRVRRFASALAALLLLSASVAHADVFNMPNGEAGGERGTGAAFPQARQ